MKISEEIAQEVMEYLNVRDYDFSCDVDDLWMNREIWGHKEIWLMADVVHIIDIVLDERYMRFKEAVEGSHKGPRDGSEIIGPGESHETSR